MKPGKDEILKDLLEFFFEEFENDTVAVADWVVQGGWDCDEFIAAARKLRQEIKLRD